MHMPFVISTYECLWWPFQDTSFAVLSPPLNRLSNENSHKLTTHRAKKKTNDFFVVAFYIIKFINKFICTPARRKIFSHVFSVEFRWRCCCCCCCCVFFIPFVAYVLLHLLICFMSTSFVLPIYRQFHTFLLFYVQNQLVNC